MFFVYFSCLFLIIARSCHFLRLSICLLTSWRPGRILFVVCLLLAFNYHHFILPSIACLCYFIRSSILLLTSSRPGRALLYYLRFPFHVNCFLFSFLFIVFLCASVLDVFYLYVFYVIVFVLSLFFIICYFLFVFFVFLVFCLCVGFSCILFVCVLSPASKWGQDKRFLFCRSAINSHNNAIIMS